MKKEHIKLEIGKYIKFKNTSYKDTKEIYYIADQDLEEKEESFYLQSPVHYSYSWRCEKEYIIAEAIEYKPGFIEAIILYFKLKKYMIKIFKMILLLPFVLLRFLQIITFAILFILIIPITYILLSKADRAKLNKDIFYIGLDTKDFT